MGASERYHVPHEPPHSDPFALHLHWHRLRRVQRKRCGRDLGRILRQLGLVADHDLEYHRDRIERVNEWQRLLDHVREYDIDLRHGGPVWILRARDDHEHGGHPDAVPSLRL